MIYKIQNKLFYSDYLEHFNIKGSHWGIRRWQYQDGTLTPEGKIRYRKGDGKREGNPRHTPSKARRERKAEEKKEKILRTGKASDVLKIKDQLSPEELRTAYARLQTEDNIRNIANKEPKQKTAFETVDDFMSKVGKAANWADNATKFYTNVNKLINTLSGDSVQLPTSSKAQSSSTKTQGSSNSRRKERRKEVMDTVGEQLHKETMEFLTKQK